MKDIRLHKEYGLNPTCPVCFWCGETKNEVALLGAKYKGQAPSRMVLDYEPCPKCVEVMKQGILMIEADNAHKLQRPALDRSTDMAPTGRWLVIKDHALSDLGMKPELEEAVRRARRTMIEPALFSQLFGDLDGTPNEGSAANENGPADGQGEG